MIKYFCLWLLFCCPFLLFGADTLPDLGDPSSQTLTPQEERRLGETIMFQIRHRLNLSQDQWLQLFVKNLGDRLSSAQPGNTFPYTFFVVNDKSINAFALPGGFIGVNTGLLLAVSDEHELASVLAHEMAHVSQHHIARLYEHAQQVQLSTLAGMVAAIILATQNPNLGSGAIAATMAGQQQAFLNFSRDHEREADRIGIQTLAQANFNPQAMPHFFEKLWKSTQYYGQQVPEFLRTHPLTEARIADSRARANQYPIHTVTNDLTFVFLQARVRANSFNTPQEAKSYFTPRQKDAAAAYGLAISAVNQGDGATATALLKPLIRDYPHILLIQSTYFDGLFLNGRTTEALNLLQKTVQQFPAHLALVVQYNLALLDQQKPTEVIQNSHLYELYYGPTPEIQQLLSKAYALLSQPANMHFAQAHFLLLMGDYRGSLLQLKQAKKLTSAPSPLLLQIEARIIEIEQTLEQIEGHLHFKNKLITVN